MRRTIRETCLVFALALGAALLMGPTWPSDDAGRPAAQCSFIGSTLTPTLCSTTDPLPVSTGGPTQSTTDPTGWGRNWFSASGLTNGTRYVVFAAEGQTFYAVERLGAACPFGQVRTFVSDNGGRTFTLRDTSAESQTSGVAGSARVSGATGTFLIAATDCGGVNNFQILRSQSGFQFTRATRPAAGVCSAGSSCSFFNIAVQGNTVIASGSTPATIRCRSTDGGTSFPSCVSTGPTSSSYHAISSPAPSIWLAYDQVSDTLFRSTDDGVLWTSVLTAVTAGSGRGVVECLSSTVCLAAGGSTIYRSINAGVTWAAEFGEPFNNNVDGLLSFGSGVAVAWSPTADRVYRTNDFGDTWNFQVIGPNIDTGEVTGDYLGGATLNGRGVFGGGQGGAVQNVAYSPIVGSGETIVAGQTGSRWEIDANGAGRVRIPPGVDGSALGTNLSQVDTQRDGFAQCSTPAVNTAAVVTIVPTSPRIVRLYAYIAFYDVAPAAPTTLTVVTGATTRWRDIVGGANTPTRSNWTGTITSFASETMTITLPAGGVGVTGSLCTSNREFVF